MKNFLLKILLVFAMLISISPSAMALETFLLDPSHTSVLFHISHFGFSYPTGKWMASGTLVLDQKTPANSKVDVTIPLSNVVTGVPKLDEHLKSKDFFDVQKYPVATFVSNKVEVTGVDTATVTGILNLHGVSKEITLNVKLNRIGKNPIIGKTAAGFSATGELNRSEFGITNDLPFLSDKVKLDIEVEADAAQS